MRRIYTRGGVVVISLAGTFLGLIIGYALGQLPVTAHVSWLTLSALALGSAFTVKVADIAYQEVRRHLDKTQSATKFVDEHLDPLLKAADEVVGKLLSLATEDFRSIAGMSLSLKRVTDNDFGALLYLFARLWAQIEIIRIEGLAVAIAEDQRGAKLQSFLACLESRRVRIVDRISQRAVGELLMKTDPNRSRTMGYVEFVRSLEANDETRRWIEPLAAVFRKTHHTETRQLILQYGVVVHALIDSLDPNHLVTSERPSYPNKLSQRTRTALKYRVFGVYLTFVTDRAKYVSTPRKAVSKKG